MKALQQTITKDADESSHDAAEHCQDPQQTTTALLDNSHPLASLFPLMEDAEYAGLVEDIRANGLRAPIVVDGRGHILDGRNRLRACLDAGVEYTKTTFSGDDDAPSLCHLEKPAPPASRHQPTGNHRGGTREPSSRR